MQWNVWTSWCHCVVNLIQINSVWQRACHVQHYWVLHFVIFCIFELVGDGMSRPRWKLWKMAFDLDWGSASGRSAALPLAAWMMTCGHSLWGCTCQVEKILIWSGPVSDGSHDATMRSLEKKMQKKSSSSSSTNNNNNNNNTNTTNTNNQQPTTNNQQATTNKQQATSNNHQHHHNQHKAWPYPQQKSVSMR